MYVGYLWISWKNCYVGIVIVFIIVEIFCLCFGEVFFVLLLDVGFFLFLIIICCMMFVDLLCDIVGDLVVVFRVGFVMDIGECVMVFCNVYLCWSFEFLLLLVGVVVFLFVVFNNVFLGVENLFFFFLRLF